MARTDVNPRVMDDDARTFLITGHIETPAEKTYVLDQKAYIDYEVVSWAVKTASGTITCSLRVEGVEVDSLAASSTEAEEAAIGPEDVDSGETLSIVTSSNSSSADLTFSVLCRKKREQS